MRSWLEDVLESYNKCKIESRVEGPVELIGFTDEVITRGWIDKVERLPGYGGYYPMLVYLNRFPDSMILLVKPGNIRFYGKSPYGNESEALVKYKEDKLYLDIRSSGKSIKEKLKVTNGDNNKEYYYGIFASFDGTSRYLTVLGSYAPKDIEGMQHDYSSLEDLVDIVKGDRKIGKIDTAMLIVILTNEKGKEREVYLLVPKRGTYYPCLKELEKAVDKEEIRKISEEVKFGKYFLGRFKDSFGLYK